MKAERCRAETKGGKPCGATVVAPSGLCAGHAPEWADRRREWSRKGGERRSNHERAKKQVPAAVTAKELGGWLGVLFRGVVGGKIAPKVGTAAAMIARAMLEAREAGELEERLAALEAAAGVDGRSA